MRWLGARTYPKLSHLSAELHGPSLTVRYQVARRASRLYITVHQGERVLLSVAEPISERAGAVEVLLPEMLAECLVRASAFNEIRQRSDPLEAVATQS